MKNVFYLFICSTFLSSCLATDPAEKLNSSPVKFDGVYIADDFAAKPVDKLIDGKPINTKHSILILRFYNQNSGIIVPETIDDTIKTYNDSLINRYYDWCKEFCTKNPADTSYVNFRYQYLNDSISFLQKAPEFSFEYNGKVFGDSLQMIQTIDLKGNGHSANVHKKYNFKFHKISI